MTKYPFPKSIEEAAAILDKDKPDWEKQINLSILEMYQPYSCILGQLYGDYGDGIESLFNKDEIDDSSGIHTPFFGSKVDKNLWIEQINKRLDAKRDFTWALEQVRLGKKMCCDGVTSQNYPYIIQYDGQLYKAIPSNSLYSLNIQNLIDYSRAIGWKEYSPATMVKQGSRIKLDNEDEYIVSKFSSTQLGLINLIDGNRWAEPIKVDDILNTVDVQQFFEYYKPKKIEVLKY